MRQKPILKRKAGAPAYIPTSKEKHQVMGMVTAGFTIAEIARCLKIHPETCSKAFADELACTDTKRTGRIANKLYKVALAGDTRAMEMYLRKKSRAFKEREDKSAAANISVLASLIGHKLLKE